MKKLCPIRITFAINLLLICSFSFAAEFQGVEYMAPSGWKAEDSNGAIGFLPDDVAPETATVLVLGPAQNLEGIAFDVWLQQKLKEELQDGSKVLQESEIQKQQQGNLATATLVRVTQEADGSNAIRMYHAVSDGKKAAMAIAMSVSQEGTNKYATALQSFFSSLRIAGPAADSPSIRSSTQSGNSERVPESGIVNGIPQGMFVGRSLLTGKAVCLLFLSGGRITRAIPQNGLEHFDWTKHQQEHSGDSGKWEIRGNLLRIVWGDSGVNEGPLTVTADGIEFYGKRYARPTTAGIAAIAGKWESARGTAIYGGEGINMTNTLIIDRDGSFHWETGVGGEVSGRAVSNETNRTGKLQITGSTMTFLGKDGTEASYTFVPLPGSPIVAFSLGSNMFTRAD
jgi:hypothetical protein